MHKKILNFCLLPAPHTGEVIAQSLELCLKSWGIKKISTITVDNATSNDVAVRSFGKRMGKQNALLGDGEFLHVRCAAHIVNLIVRDGIAETKDSIYQIQNSIKWIKSSPARQQKFHEALEHEGFSTKSTLCLDVVTHWNSTYLMLNSALKLQKAFERLPDINLNYVYEDRPTDDDWENASALCKFLESFYNITTHFSGSLYVTSNFYFIEVCKIERLLNSLSHASNVCLRDMSR